MIVLRPGVREHLLLGLIYVASRAALLWAGLRFDFSLDWMWLADPLDLRDRLMETLFYYHAFPPGMSLLTGILLKLGGAHAATLALAAFWALGLVIVNSLFYLARVSGISGPVALGMAAAFSMLPQAIYFEHLYLYEYPITALLSLAAVFLYRGVRDRSVWSWFGFFAACSAVGLTRSTFHLVWFAAMLGLGLWTAMRPGTRTLFPLYPPHSGPRRAERAKEILVTGRQTWRLVLRAAAVPAGVLLALYVKNFVVFGVFDAFTFGFVSHNLVTTWHLSDEVRDRWIADGTLSPLAAVNVYAGPREYLPYFETSESSAWPPQLSLLERPSVGAENYNHWLFLEVSRRRRADALYYLRTRPREYAATVLTGVRDVFTPSTEWHPLDTTDESPHAQHRQLLGGYEALYNRVVHGVPAAPVGLYLFLPLILAWTARRVWVLVRSGDADAAARGALFAWCLFQIAFVVAASSVFTFRESARYRFQVEPAIWLMTAVMLTDVRRAFTGRRGAASGTRPTGAGFMPWTAMRPRTRILFPLFPRIAVLGARSAPSQHCQPVKGEPPQRMGYQGRALDWFDTAQIRRYYDRNTRGFVAFGQGGRAGAIHRAVWGPGVHNRREAFHYVDERIAELVRGLPMRSEPPHVVDLGCGVGASLRYLAERLPIRGSGLTLSPVQARFATRLVAEAGLAERVACLEGDYCDIPEGIGGADLAYAIESFVHAPEPARFFEQCRRLVRPGGLLVMCDDVRGVETGSAADRTIARFMRGWHVNALLRPDALHELARAWGFEHVSTQDLTPYLELSRTRDRLIGGVLLLTGWLPLDRTPLGPLRGGQALQICLERGWIQYQLAVFRRM
ncbi:MAG: class I SAM-dependent methyltransferase [Acidobacteria bacterium]|nr:class I SAM-dependent methyltransferase [Acidobacteriota bacterium]